MPAEKDSTTPEKAIKKNRVQLKHLLLDVDFFDKPTVRALVYKHGHLAALTYMRWLMLMSRASNAFVTRDALFSIAREVLAGVSVTVATPENVLAYCLKTGMIEQCGDDEYTNDRVVKDQESCADKREKSISRVEKHREKKRDECNALQTRTPDPATDTVLDPNSSLKIDKKLSSLTKEALDAVQQWAAHRRKLNLPFDEEAANCLQKDYEWRPEDLIKNVRWSIQNSWRTVRPAPKSDSNGNTAIKFIAPGLKNQQATFDAMTKILKECEENET